MRCAMAEAPSPEAVHRAHLYIRFEGEVVALGDSHFFGSNIIDACGPGVLNGDGCIDPAAGNDIPRLPPPREPVADTKSNGRARHRVGRGKDRRSTGLSHRMPLTGLRPAPLVGHPIPPGRSRQRSQKTLSGRELVYHVGASLRGRIFIMCSPGGAWSQNVLDTDWEVFRNGNAGEHLRVLRLDRAQQQGANRLSPPGGLRPTEPLPPEDSPEMEEAKTAEGHKGSNRLGLHTRAVSGARRPQTGRLPRLDHRATRIRKGNRPPKCLPKEWSMLTPKQKD